MATPKKPTRKTIPAKAEPLTPELVTAPNHGKKAARPRDVESFLATVRTRFQQCEEAEDNLRREALEDLKFRAGDQWPAEIKSARDIDKRPCLTINRLPTFIKQVSNEQRQNRPACQVNPVDSGADEDTAEVLEGIIRHIELNSSADTAYDTAFEHAVTFGFGFFRILTEFQDELSFDQEILIKRIPNPFNVFLDPAATECDRSDARFAFICQDITHEDFEEQYPNSELAGFQALSTVGNRTPNWITTSHVRIAEYFWIEREEKKLCMLETGQCVLEEKLPPGAVVKQTRQTMLSVVKWIKTNGSEILEENIWPGKYIPIVPVLGDEINLDGERQLVGLVRYARDSQRMYNFWVSAETEMIALAPRAPFIGAEGQFEGHEAAWRQANTKNLSFLQYKEKSVGGQLVGPPSRQAYEPPIQAISTARMQSADDLKATMGIFDASLGANSQDKSGKAVLARKAQGDTATYHFTDNLTRSIKYLAKQLIDLIPKIYDAPRVMRIIGEDQSVKSVQVNQPSLVGGVQKIYDLTTGRYDVTVSAGPSYFSRRQEAIESMGALFNADPEAMKMFMDFYLANMDWPQAKEMAARAKKLLPPGLEDDKDNLNQIPPQAKAQMQQQAQMLDMMTKRMHEMTDILATRKIETDSKERIELMKAQVQLLLGQAALGQKNSQALLGAEVNSIQHRMDLLSSGQSEEADRQHQLTIQQAQQQHEREMASLQQSHEADQNTQAQQATSDQQQQAQEAAAQMPKAA